MRHLFLVIFLFIGISAFSQTVIKPAIGMNFTSLSDDPQSYEPTGRMG